MNRQHSHALFLVGLLALPLACSEPLKHPATNPKAAAQTPLVRSNILRSDYAGSAECRSCHADIFDAWNDSPMHHMTRRAEEAHIEAPFDHATFELGNDSVTMEEHDGHKLMRLVSTNQGTHLYQITKVIGGRYREDFAGIDVTDAHGPIGDASRATERILPVSFVFSTQSWRYKGYSVMLPERPSLEIGPVWSQTCIGCHNTMPYLLSIYDDLYGPKAPRYQGSVSDHLLPSSRTWSFSAIDQGKLKEAIGDEIDFMGGKRPDLDDTSLRDVLAQGIVVERQKLRGSHLVEVGVGCEACHGGAREHVLEPHLRPTFEVRSPLLETRPPTGKDPTQAQWINQTCAHCHTVLFSRYPWTWEGGRRSDRNPGGSTTNSGEARDFLLGGCSTQMSCTSCHNPHAEDRPQDLHALEGARGNTLCASCHTDLASEAAIGAHTHHRPDSEGSSCLGCHMPKKNMGLGYGLTRYHRIGSPTDEVRVLGDRPIECALCHQDKSVEDLVGTMERWWGKRYDRRELRALYGDDLSVNVLASTLARGKPHEQAVAIALFGDSHAETAVPLLVPQLSHEYPLVRYFAKHALENILGQPLPIDVNGQAAEIAIQARKWQADYTIGTSAVRR